MSITVNWPLGAMTVPSKPDFAWLIGVGCVEGLARAARGVWVVGGAIDFFLLVGFLAAGFGTARFLAADFGTADFAVADFTSPTFLLVALARVDFAPVLLEAAMESQHTAKCGRRADRLREVHRRLGVRGSNRPRNDKRGTRGAARGRERSVRGAIACYR